MHRGPAARTTKIEVIELNSEVMEVNIMDLIVSHCVNLGCMRVKQWCLLHLEASLSAMSEEKQFIHSPRLKNYTTHNP